MPLIRFMLEKNFETSLRLKREARQLDLFLHKRRLIPLKHETRLAVQEKIDRLNREAAASLWIP